MRLRSKPFLVVLGTAAVIAAGATVVRAWAVACTSPAAYGLYASSYADTMLNPGKAEDVDFFTASGGVPNIMVLLDTSLSMNRLAPNGPHTYGTLPVAGTVGCGAAAAEGGLSAAPGTMVANINARLFSSACGTALSNLTAGSPAGTLGQALLTPYSSSFDYAHEASTCGYWANPNVLTGKDGWDPDWYCGSGSDAQHANLACSGQNAVNFFDKNIVVHDSEATGTPYDGTTMKGDGWSYAGVFPHLASGSNPASIADVCTALAALPGMPANTSSVCNTCLTTRGWFFDGRIDASVTLGDSPTPQSVPNLWYTGNYLNFFPPKFLVARKILKDTVMRFSKVRAAIASITNTGAQTDQQFFPTCDQPDANWDSSRKTYMDALDKLPITGGKPLSKALLDIGWYYHSVSLPWFNGWPHTAPLSGQDPADVPSGNTKGNISICYSCQVSSVILVTDGLPTKALEDCSSGNPLPVGPSSLADATAGTYAGASSTGINKDCSVPAASDGVSPTSCPECYAFTGTDDYKNNLSRVAWYLHNYDLRQNGETKCLENGGRQNLDFYAIGFGGGTAAVGADQLLSNAAKVGGGLYVPANSADDVRAALATIRDVINTRATSFSVATISPVQTQAGHSVIVPRFEPARAPFWKGHLSRYELYSEFVNGCKPTGNPADGDLDCDGTCGGVFLTDGDVYTDTRGVKRGHFIQEDGTGAVMQNQPDLPSCSESKCGTCGVAGSADAKPWWDAGKVLAARAWSDRMVYTVVDSAAPTGTLDASDATVLLRTDDATADKLIPYMNLLGTSVCSQLANDISNAGDTVAAADILTDTTKRACAKEIIRYVLGADSFNSKNLGSPDYPPASRDLLQDRDWKLGDIFHSSPIVVDAPAPADGILCARGLSRQCIPSLWNTPVPSDVPSGTTQTAYDLYSKSALYQHRRKIVLVGANDGMLHAFNGGKFLDNQDDTVATPPPFGVDESKPPFNGYYERANSGDELWAFVPPDQLPKLHLLLGPTHNLFVDGTPMVRDVWVDNAANGNTTLLPSVALDDKKQPGEFHTVAVVSERRGGVHYFALDLTDAFRQKSEAGFTPPKFLWMYPQPSSKQVLYAGETYSDYVPLPPPIGPVRIKADASSSVILPAPSPTSTTPTTSSGVAFHERWVAFLSGGFDPQYVRGRGVHMVDVWTGKEYFDFSYPITISPTNACSSPLTDPPRCFLKYPVAGTVAMVMWGKDAKNLASFRNDGYFDTATFGDTGGQLWVLRFNEPGALDGSTGLATNWFGGRIFQMGAKSTYCRFCNNEPFFYITSNVALAGDGTFRVMAGTGDRYNLLDQNGGICSPDNIRACLQRGCRVTLDANFNQAAEGDKGNRVSGLASTACLLPSFYDVLDTTYATCDVQAAAKVVIDACPAYTSSQVPTVSTKDMQLTCSSSGLGYACSYRTGTTPTTGSPLSLAEGTYSITQINKFFSIRVFDTAGSRTIFSDAAGAAAYDSARLTDGNLVQIDGAATSPATLSSVADSGYVINFNHTPSVTIDTVAYTVVRQDERVSSPTSIGSNCAVFNTTQTTSSASTSNTCGISPCTQLNRRVHYLYGADATSGALCLTDSDGDLVRSIGKVALVPPAAPQFTLFVSGTGQVQAGLTRVVPEKGAGNVPLGGAIDPATILESIDVSRDVHDCRHADPNGSTPSCN